MYCRLFVIAAYSWFFLSPQPASGTEERDETEAVAVDLDALTEVDAPSRDDAVAVDLEAIGEAIGEEEAVDLDALDAVPHSEHNASETAEDEMLPLNMDIPERSSNPWLALLALGVFLPISAMFIPPVKRKKKRTNRLERVKKRAT